MMLSGACKAEGFQGMPVDHSGVIDDMLTCKDHEL